MRETTVGLSIPDGSPVDRHNAMQMAVPRTSTDPGLIRLTKPSEAPSPGGKAVAGIVGFAPQNEFIIDEQTSPRSLAAHAARMARWHAVCFRRSEVGGAEDHAIQPPRRSARV